MVGFFPEHPLFALKFALKSEKKKEYCGSYTAVQYNLYIDSVYRTCTFRVGSYPDSMFLQQPACRPFNPCVLIPGTRQGSSAVDS